jgi:hypothetical protein
MSATTETRIVAVDGTDALAYVIIRPNPGNPTKPIVVEAAASGLSHKAAAYVLRDVADRFDPEGAPKRTATPTAEPATADAVPGQLALFEVDAR